MKLLLRKNGTRDTRKWSNFEHNFYNTDIVATKDRLKAISDLKASKEFSKEDGQIDVTAFYAEIISIDENAVTVKGIALNEKEYRQEVTFQLHESVIIEWNNQPLTIGNLGEGDLVSIILIEDVLGVEDIFKIQLLEG